MAGWEQMCWSSFLCLILIVLVNFLNVGPSLVLLSFHRFNYSAHIFTILQCNEPCRQLLIYCFTRDNHLLLSC